jgi:uncharacterized membrane protein YfcA
MIWDIGRFFLFFLIIAFVYSSVGFGGGSSYLAVLAMYNLPYQEIRLTALICNVIVVVGGVYIYIKNKQVDWKKVLPITFSECSYGIFGSSAENKPGNILSDFRDHLIIAAVLLWIKTDTKNEQKLSQESVCSIGK